MTILANTTAQPGAPENSELDVKASGNPARGCLFIGKGVLNNDFLFVFRRCELQKTSELAMQPRTYEDTETAEHAPPKNKRDEFRLAIVAINRKPLTGFSQFFSRLDLSKQLK
jgi:hypothetical protein